MGFFSRRPDTVATESSHAYYRRSSERVAAKKHHDRRYLKEEPKRFNKKGEVINNGTLDKALTEFAEHSTRSFTDTFYEVADLVGEVVPIDNRETDPVVAAPGEAYRAAVKARKHHHAPKTERLYQGSYHY